MSDNLEYVKEALDEGADINTFKYRKSRLWDNYASDNPLLVSIFNGRDKIAEYLIESGADVNYICSNEKSILYYLAEQGVITYCERIIDKGADINFVTKDGKSVLQCTIESNFDSLTNMLLDKEDILVTKENIDTAIMNINKKQYSNCYGYLKKLLEHNDNVDRQIYNSIFECQKLLNEEIKDENIYLVSGAVAIFGQSNVLDEIIKNNNVDIKRLYLLACRYGNIDNVKYLLSKGVDINSANDIGKTAVEIAVENNQNEVVNYLLDSGVEVKGRKGTNYDDILTYAVKNDNYDITKLLITDYNNNLNLNNAVMEAAMNSSQALKALLDSGISPDYNINSNEALLQYACLAGNYEGAKVLLEYGANVNEPSGYPLLNAVKYGNTDCVKLLCNYNVDLDFNTISDGDSTSTLFYAVRHGYLDIAQILVENGAVFRDKYEVELIMPYAEKSKNINKFLTENGLI